MLIFHPVLVATDSSDEEGQLAFHDGKLVAILVRLAGVEHREDRGRLYVEASFGSLSGHPAQTFSSLDEAADWLNVELGAGAQTPACGRTYETGKPVSPGEVAALAQRDDRAAPR
ncbi:hypothetical protein ASG43_13885 [Aureimonas sp. Leaf454]|uniref:hypothetical protein n=1 Tax=Aureimonas sp. Leaf454 TaxID=1736381 RepID=UPI0006FC3D8A|nr:hypothetical protein [Aureimonas sp. Leaf454]KQT44434.1 hypothetical protein ASG43_13885 [Aureimonas sp. Leaf454]